MDTHDAGADAIDLSRALSSVESAALPPAAAVGLATEDTSLVEPTDPAVAAASARRYGISADTGGTTTGLPAEADREAAGEPYRAANFFRQAKSIPWRFGGAAAAITVTGLANWNWGSAPFRFQKEGWFGRDTANLGMDKLGHAWTGYVLTEFFTDGINRKSGQNRSSVYTGAILAMGLMTYIEIFDGFSKDHGFSNEDLVVDAAGVLLSVARRTIPGLRDKIDFRLLYTPSRSTIRALGCLPAPHCERDGATVRSPITDYSNQKYLIALKMAGFEGLKQTPLRLVELHAGYYGRGFTREDEERGKPLRRVPFVGIGLNVSQLLFPGRPRRPVGRAAKSVLEYVQLPYTAIHSE